MSSAQQIVKLSDLYDGRIVQAQGESAVDFEDRILDMEAAQDFDGGPSKVLAFVDAMERGVALPPIFIAKMGNELHSVDGWRRCAAAAFHGRVVIRAVVFQAGSYEACDSLSALFFDFEDTNTPWQLRADAGSALLAA